MKTAKLIISLLAVFAAAACSRTDPEVDLFVNASELSLSRKGSEARAYLEIQSNHPWTASIDADWLKMFYMEGVRDKEYKSMVSAGDNPSSEPRTAVITISSGDRQRKVVVTQEAGTMVLTPSQVADFDRIYIPAEYSSDKFLRSDGRWFFGRSVQSEHFIVFWEAGYGENGTTTPSACPDPKYKVNLDRLLDLAERCYSCYIDELGFVTRGKSQLDRYKFEIFLHHQEEWAAYGGGQDDVIGSLWVNPQAANGDFTVAHEIGHSFQYQVYCDKLLNREAQNDWHTGFRYNRPGENGCGFWEQCAQWMAYQVCPEELFLEWQFPDFYANCHRHFLHEDMRYASNVFQFYMTDTCGMDAVAKVWRNGIYPQDALQSYMDVFGLDNAGLNAQIYDYASRVATWDFSATRVKGLQYLDRIPWHAAAGSDGWYEVAEESSPEATGFNIIPLKDYGTGKEVSLSFEGLPGDGADAKDGGWTVGFVALSSNNATRYYSAPQTASSGTDGKAEVTWTVPSDASRVWAVVAATPSRYITHLWDDDNANDRQWPYRISLDGATPVKN